MGAPRIISEEQEKEAIKIALAGENPLRYLEKCGASNPPAKWYAIKLKIKDTDPDTYEKLPKKIQRKDAVQKAVETPEGEFSVKPEILKAVAETSVCRPVNYDGFEFGVAKSTETGFRYEWSPEYKLFSIKAKGDELTLHIDDMRKLMEEAPKAARVMGVEL